MGTMEERTIGIVGRTSFMITLPRGWLRFHGLNPGDKVEVITNGELRVRPKRTARQGTTAPGKVRKGDGPES